MDNLAEVLPLERIMLAGKEYELAPLSLNMLCEIEARFPDVDPVKKLLDGKLATVRFLLYLRLRGNYPDVTEESIGNLVTWHTLTDIMRQAVKI